MTIRACLFAFLIFSAITAQEREPAKTATTAGQRAAQRKRDAQGTREFLGLGAPPDAEAAKRGEKLYAASCSFCHGAKATGGDTGPDLVRSSLVLHDEKGELIGPVIHNGRANKGMPAFAAFTDAELYDLAQFLHMRVELAANRGTYKLLNAITGDAKAGEAYFRGAGKCSSCHSVTGDLAGIGSKLSPADLQQTFLYPRRESGAAKIKVTLPSGEVVTGAAQHLDDFNVILCDAAGEYRSIALGPGVKVEMEDKLKAHRQLLDQYTDTDMHNLTAYLQTLK
ncbi:MAG: c-type cytochrome [Acidobacteriaceae bacterium]|nr:c-type cytochrome [Acidobacteriaceae bacterium]